MPDEKNYRLQRIERLLEELRYEVTRGMMEREIEEEMGFTFMVGASKHFKNGVVQCEFRTRPVQHMAYLGPDAHQPKLRVVSGGKQPPVSAVDKRSAKQQKEST